MSRLFVIITLLVLASCSSKRIVRFDYIFIKDKKAGQKLVVLKEKYRNQYCGPSSLSYYDLNKLILESSFSPYEDTRNIYGMTDVVVESSDFIDTSAGSRCLSVSGYPIVLK